MVKATSYHRLLRYIRRIEARAMRLTKKAKDEPDPDKRRLQATAAVKLFETARNLRDSASSQERSDRWKKKAIKYYELDDEIKAAQPGKVLVHNQVLHGPRTGSGVGGFRAWEDEPLAHYFVCSCGWRQDLGTHYRVKDDPLQGALFKKQ